MAVTILEARQRRRLTLQRLALLCDTSYSHLCRLECGWQALTPKVAARLAPVLGVPAEALLTGQAALRQELRARLGAEIGAGAAGAAL